MHRASRSAIGRRAHLAMARALLTEREFLLLSVITYRQRLPAAPSCVAAKKGSAMPLHSPVVPADPRWLALVDGDPALRHARQLMLRSRNLDVRAYSTCAALLADPLALRSACVVADVEMREMTGIQLLQAMRQAGWAGAAVLLTDADSDTLVAANDHDLIAILPKTLSDDTLLNAIQSAISREGPRKTAFDGSDRLV
jgi:CheY-like chemotaxis protein